LFSIAVTPSAHAQTHVDLLDKRSSRTGGVIVDERTGRIDVDRDANRVGCGLDRTTGRLGA